MPSGRFSGMYASPAISAIDIALSGEPFTWNLPSRTSMSSGAASSWWATIAFAFLATFSAARATASPPPVAAASHAPAPAGDCTRAVRVEALRAGRRVAVDALDLLGVEPEAVGD